MCFMLHQIMRHFIIFKCSIIASHLSDSKTDQCLVIYMNPPFSNSTSPFCLMVPSTEDLCMNLLFHQRLKNGSFLILLNLPHSLAGIL